MNTDKFFNTLNVLLEDGRISHVINVLQHRCEIGFTEHPDLQRLLPTIESIRDTYGRMREYTLNNIEDPQRDRFYEEIKQQLRDVARQYLFILNENRNDSFFAEYRMQKVRRRPLADLVDELEKTDYRVTMAGLTEADPLQFIKKKEDIVANIFRMIWSMPPWAEADRKTVMNILTDDETASFELKSQAISALLLGLLKFYDPNKLLILIRAYSDAADERLAARALMSIVLVMARWGESITAEADVRDALAALADSILTYTHMRDIVMTLIKTRDTDRVNKEVNEAFNSTMKHITPDMLDRLRNEGISVDSAETGMNPEWEKLMRNKDFEERMQSINDMQLEGLDVMMQTFSRLKSFPFFQSLPNWFLPFSSSHSAVAPLFEKFNEDAFAAMGQATDMCASDRFSFALGIMQMPEERRNMLASHLGAQLDEVRDLIKDKENVARKSLFTSECIVFARDLYRFAKIYPKRNLFFDPFDLPIDFLRLPILGELLTEEEIMLSAADFYFRYGYYSLALGLYEKAIASGKADRGIYERIGFCHQMDGDYQMALENYERADLFSSDVDKSGTWLLKKLAFCNKALGNYSAAADFYRRVAELNPDDLSPLFHFGSVLLRAGDTEAAMELLSKVHYLKPESHSYARAFARGLVARGGEENLEDAFLLLEKLAEGPKADVNDVRLKGHLAFLTGRLHEAVSLYIQAKGDLQEPEFRSTVIAELKSLAPFDLRKLQILLDSL